MRALTYFLKIHARQRIGRPPRTPHGARPDRPYTLDERRAIARYAVNDVRQMDYQMHRDGFSDREAWLRSLKHYQPTRKLGWRFRVFWSRFTKSSLSDPYREDRPRYKRLDRTDDEVKKRIKFVKQRMDSSP